MGLDEVGRGPVAGPLAIGAVVLPGRSARVEGVNDSKQLSAERREEIAAVVREVAIAWDIEYIQPQEIDEHGMTWALRTANLRAIAAIEEQLSAKRHFARCGIARWQRAAPRRTRGQHCERRWEMRVHRGGVHYREVDRDALMCRYAEQFPPLRLPSRTKATRAPSISEQ